MWYFTWILGVGLALAAAIITAMWLESNEEQTGLGEQATSAAAEAAHRSGQQ